jgi:hypothetical protein
MISNPKEVYSFMSGFEELKKVIYPPKPSSSILSHIPPGVRLRLRENAYRQLREREWIFNRTKNDLIFLIHETGAYGIVVGIQDIDWGEFQLNSVKN